jgi:hypothetical protein
MTRRRFRPRPNGVIELRRRVTDLEVFSLVSALVLTTFLFLSLLVATLLASPALLVIATALAAPGLWGAWLARSVRFAPAAVPTAPRPPPRRAA